MSLADRLLMLQPVSTGRVFRTERGVKKTMKLILHLGAHKTGTTAIQFFLNKNNDALHQHDWEFVKIRNRPANRCVDFCTRRDKVVFSLKSNSYEVLLSELTQNERNKIVSAEDLFFLNNDDQIKRFGDDMLARFDEILVIVYLRNQVEMAVSNKAQGAKTIQSSLVFGNNYKHPLPEINCNVAKYLDYYSKIKKWQDALPNCQFIVRKYSRTTIRDGDSVTDFIDITGLPIETEKVNAHKSFGSIKTNILHGLRANGMSADSASVLSRPGFFDDIGGVEQKPSRDQAIAFMENFKTGNEKIAREFGISLSLDEERLPELASIQGLPVDLILRESGKVFDRLIATRDDRAIDTMRDCALLLEDTNLRKACDLMAIAHSLRPNGPFIKKKLNEYKEQLANNTQEKLIPPHKKTKSSRLFDWLVRKLNVNTATR